MYKRQPVTVDDQYSWKDLLFLLSHDQDPYMRYEVACRLKIALISEQMNGLLIDEAGQTKYQAFKEAMHAIVFSQTIDSYLKGVLLSPLSLDYLIQVCSNYPSLEALDNASRQIQIDVFASIHKDIANQYQLGLRNMKGDSLDAINQRYLNNVYLNLIMHIEPTSYSSLALHQ